MSALDELRDYVDAHTMRVPRGEAPIAIDMHFFSVLVGEDFDKDHFKKLMVEWLFDGRGEFGPVTADELAAGPSYIAWGGWIGDQGLAMQVMAAGQYAGVWTVITPELLGFDGPQADAMAGTGYVMTSGLAGGES